jgi:putative DNA primase/helicase
MTSALAARGWPVFPCKANKRPCTQHGFKEASIDSQVIESWWCRWPNALVGLPTGTHAYVLDVDRKHGNDGLNTLNALGFSLWFETPTAQTPSGGLHAYFRPPEVPFGNTQGERGRGIGPGLDWRALGGYIIASSPGSGYRWDPVLGPDTPLAEIPEALLPKDPEPSEAERPTPTAGLSPYAAAALADACRKIQGAPSGQQEATINGEAFSIGTLAASGAIPSEFARAELLWAAQQIRSYDSKRPWRAAEIRSKVERAFAAGLRRPR